MSVLLSSASRVLVQGLTGSQGAANARRMRDYGTRLVGGVTPGRGGGEWEGLPLFDTVAEAREATGADTSIIFVPPPGAADAMVEAIDAGLATVVCITDGVPVHDMLAVRARLHGRATKLVGPNCPGVITPGEAKLGIMPDHVFAPGRIGVVSRSGSLSYEVCYDLSKKGLGQSTVVGIGGDPVKGLTMVEVLAMMRKDPQTEAIVLIGEIGGSDEEVAAATLGGDTGKPVVAFIAGQTAPSGRKMGHASAIVTGNRGSYASKVDALRSAGVAVASDPWQVAELLAGRLGERGSW